MADRMPGRGTVARVFLPFAFGYFLSYLFRVINAVIAPALVADLALSPADLGLLTGIYFITFAAAQLPLGIVLDRWGARRTEATMLLFAVAGALCFAAADGFAGVVFGRALIGLGVSACLMAAFKSFAVWFPAARLPQINGWQMAAGGLGAITATIPVAAALEVIGWRGVFMVIAALTGIAAALILFVVPEERRHGPAAAVSLAEMAAGTRRVFASPLFWRVAPMTIASQATFLAMQGLWLGPWLRDVAGLAPATVAQALLVVAVAMVAGFITLGWAGARTARWGWGPLPVTAAGISIFALVQAAIIAGATSALPLLLPLFGFFGTSAIVAYAGLTQRFPPALAGRVNTAINLLVFVAAFAVQWGMGAIIGLWPPASPGVSAEAGYRAAFGVMLAAEMAGLAWYFVYRRSAVPAG
ncbi:MAG: MFS transporter [Rhodospirillales bacterium]